jgi:uncharacterized protein (TIGR02118 family)
MPTTNVRFGLIRKKAEWDRDVFANYWHEQHGPLVAQLPNLRGYCQNLVTDRLQRGIDFARGPWDFDGFSQLWFGDASEAHHAFTNSALAAAFIADEQHFLGALHIVAAEQTEIIAVPPPPGRGRLLKRISMLRRRHGLDEDTFRREWIVHADLVRTMPGVSGYRQNVITHRQREKGKPCGYEALPIDGIVELWFESPASLEAAFGSPEGQRTMQHAKSFLGEITAFLVEERAIL